MVRRCVPSFFCSLPRCFVFDMMVEVTHLKGKLKVRYVSTNCFDFSSSSDPNYFKRLKSTSHVNRVEPQQYIMIILE